MEKQRPLLAGRYRVGRLLGKGSFGQVFYAEDTKYDPPKRVALKLFNPQYINDVQVREEIKKEASVLARFNHPNILRVIDYEITEQWGYIITDIAEGGSLQNKIQPDFSQPALALPLEEVIRYLEQMAEALDEAHSQGLIHRDLKPQNILLNKQNRPMLADFGLASALSSSTSSTSLVDASPGGTPAYMAPEQWMGQAGKVSDIYALAVLTFQMLTGQTPFQGNTHAQSYQHLRAPVPPLSDALPTLKYPPKLDAVIAEAMAKDPRQRTRPALEFYRRFKAALATTATGQLTHPLMGRSILWVDDNPLNNVYVASGLKQLGASIMAVRSTAEALEFLKVDSYDLIISDNQRIEAGRNRPNAGYELIQAVKVVDNLPVPIILFSSDVSKVDPRCKNLAFSITNSAVELRNSVLKALK